MAASRTRPTAANSPVNCFGFCKVYLVAKAALNFLRKILIPVSAIPKQGDKWGGGPFGFVF